jgi:hypothetical protein
MGQEILLPAGTGMGGRSPTGNSPLSSLVTICKAYSSCLNLSGLPCLACQAVFLPSGPHVRSDRPTDRSAGLLVGRTHLSGTAVSLVGGDPGVPMSHTYICHHKLLYSWTKFQKKCLILFLTIQKPDRQFSVRGFAAALKPEQFNSTFYKRWHARMILWLTSMNCYHAA